MINCCIDISHANGSIKWSQVPADITCVMIKATQGATFVDPQFRANFEGAIDTGRLAIPYHFLDNSPVTRQFTNFRDFVDIMPGMVIAVDWETVSKTEKRPPVSTMENFGDMVASVTGRSPLAYHGIYDLSSRKVNGWPWWVPKYGPEPKKIKWLFWQYTDKGTMAGVLRHVDRSHFVGTQVELNAWFERNVMPKGF